MRRFRIYVDGKDVHLAVYANRPYWASRKARVVFPRYMVSGRLKAIPWPTK